MREFITFMMDPVPILYLLLLGGFILFGLNRKRTGKLFLGIAGLWFLIITTPFLPKILVKSLEDKYPQLSDASITSIHGSCDIIILGGGHSDDKNLSPNNQLSTVALSRLVEGIRIHRLIRGSRLILSGSRGKSELPQALVLYRTALILGIDKTSMAMQTTPSNTRMEAEEYVKNFGTTNNLIVVTSAAHMPRAMMHFRKMGIDPIAAPTSRILKNGSYINPLDCIPSSDYIGMMVAVIHEYVGMIWVRLGGR